VKLDDQNVDRVVLDTNVFVSGGTINTGASSQIVNHWRNQDFVLVASPQLISEYEEVLQRPRIMKYTGLKTEETSQYIEEVRNRAFITPGTLTLDILINDPDDNMVLSCAEEGMASHLVTGNTKHFPFTVYKGIQVVTPRQFLNHLEQQG